MRPRGHSSIPLRMLEDKRNQLQSPLRMFWSYPSKNRQSQNRLALTVYTPASSVSLAIWIQTAAGERMEHA
ncbi:hypothetical protein KIN20_021733 [Parelaphostrongylus tenuis]|uniref:Uncharacterized protein n=1 Tax=Parelaphostrongylus tenuis TaxID=148309 RepID=A0AAD5N7B8_PARTN|nr:hypothetical protein KIN20_021733 [Parelaphostrongylus tenuis]